MIDTVIGYFETAMAVLKGMWQLRRFNERGRLIRVYGRHRIVVNRFQGGFMSIGQKCRFSLTLLGVELGVGDEGRLEIGERVFINYGVSIAAMELVKIGDRCSIGPFCNIIDNDFHRILPEERDLAPEAEPVILEDNVWLGRNVTVLKGVTIGTGSVIGAGSVVTKDIPPRSIAAGMPARVLKTM